MRIYKGFSAAIALEMTERLERKALRAHVDEETQGKYDDWELDKLTQWVEEHPAYEALPELPPETEEEATESVES